CAHGPGRHHPSSVRAERRSEHRAVVPVQYPDQPAGRLVPDARVVVQAGGDDELSVVTEADGREAVLVAAQTTNDTAGSRVEDPADPVLPGSGDQAPARVEGRGGERAAATYQVLASQPRDAPDSDRPLGRRGDEPPTVVADCEGPGRDVTRASEE